jgi:drug/metabolite transporter (DMT)-like permease
MSFYMKFLLSKVRVAEDLVGVPASFMVTASQQLVGFTMFLLLIGGSRLIGRPYTPKALASRKEFLLVLALSISFSLNIGLNLLSLSLVPLSLTMIIRACTPLSTALMQSVLQRKKQDISPGEWACMCVGVFCATAVVIAQSGGPTGKASFAFFFGVAMSVTSLFSGGLDFVFKGILGTSVKLNAIDTTCYMALPVALFTSLLGSVLVKPVSATWAARFAPSMSDFSVFVKLWQVNPAIFGYVILSGVLAFIYNTFVTFLIVKLSPATAAFAGNFNKAATILLSLVIFRELAPGVRGLVIVGAVLGNIVAFTTYNVLRKKRLSGK